MRKHVLRLLTICLASGLATFSASCLWAGDWPQWRYDAGRGAITPDELPEELHLQWIRELPPPRPAWPESQPWLRFDRSYLPVAAGGRLFVPSMVDDSVTAYDTQSGAELWRFYTDGPVRLAPVAHQGRVYFGSDDGYLYCLDAAEGTQLWRVRGGPSERKVLGNQRLISTWPVRSGPVLYHGTIYFTAGIWPFMGIFVHALDARTGSVVWTNSGEGSTYTVQPHGSPAFGGFVPRGHLAATEHGLIAPGGRTQPGCYDLETGAFRYFKFGEKGEGSYHVTARENLFFLPGKVARVDDGSAVDGIYPQVHDETGLYSLANGELVAQGLPTEEKITETTGRRGQKIRSRQSSLKQLWKLPAADVRGKLFLKAGSRFFSGGVGAVAAIEARDDDAAAEVVWRGSIQGEPWTILAADEKLFVVTTEGRIYCFGENRVEPKTYPLSPTTGAPQSIAVGSAGSNPWRAPAEGILKTAGVNEGYCVMLGLGTGKLAEALVRGSKLRLIAVDADATKVDSFRRRMLDAGLYGTRVSAHVGDPLEYRLPPYLASLIVTEDARAAGFDQGEKFVRHVFDTLRPYGGAACFRVNLKQLEGPVKQAKLPGGRLTAAGKSWSLLVREGPLPGAADWTHNYADAANSVVSQDQRVRAPLGLLWFGGPSNDEVLPRHGHGPSPQVAAGRLMIEGRDMLRALDIYTGRLLWQKQLPGLGVFYDDTLHQPGAGEIGSNYVSLEDAVYVVYGDAMLELDPESGETTREIKLEPGPDGKRPQWGHVAAWEDLLVATCGPVTVQGVDSLAPRVVSGEGFVPMPGSGRPWRYLAGADPPAEWAAVDFNADSWKQGPAGFGYGDDDDRTLLRDMPGRYGGVYVRKSFDGTDVAKAAELVLMINYDDAFIAYLNGKEILRAGVAKGKGSTASGIESHEAQGQEVFAIAGFRKLLRPGRNVIAIEGHNATVDDDDFSLDPLLMIRGAGTTGVDGEILPRDPRPIVQQLASTRYSSASRRLVVIDRNTGERVWDREAEYGFRHNNISVGADKIFCIDAISSAKQRVLKRRGRSPAGYQPRLMALDVHTGREIWSTGQDVFGTFLSYSAEHDVLLQAGSAFRDRAIDEAGTGMVAYRGRDGQVVWKNLDRAYSGPCLLHHDTIITQGFAYSLLTGEPKIRKHPLTGVPLPWEFTRNYGCNTAIGSEHLLTFRSAAAGYYDLADDGGTGNFGGFKSGCTSNLIVAGGLLNAPEYTRTCTCRYQNATSLAMVHDPDVETWTFNALDWHGQPIRRVGINFGAPGDRLASGGTLWLDYPSRGGPSPDVPIQLEATPGKYFRYHSSHVAADADAGELNWVGASGLRGVAAVTLTLAKDQTQPRKYTVRLHFAEVDDLRPGQRVFALSLQDASVLEDLDIVKLAGGRNRALVLEFTGVEVVNQLRISLTPRKENSRPPVLCGVEVVAEGW